MRHLKTDVSHRMKRRPSIFSARWFRVVLGLGVVVILGLLLGPSITGWLRGDGRPSPVAARATPKPPVAKSVAPTPATPTPPAPTPAPTAPAVEVPRPESPVATATPRPEPPAPTTAPPPPAASSVRSPAEPSRPAGDGSGGAAPARPEAAGASARGPMVYRVQVGAFLDHRNADRLIERLRSEGVEGVNTTVEETRTSLYRVLALPQDGEGYPLVLERLRALGFTPEPTEGGAIVVRPAPLGAAVDLSRRLREQGIRVRLERQASSPGLRVVRVGAYDTAEEAERARAELVGRGYEGFVIREPR